MRHSLQCYNGALMYNERLPRPPSSHILLLPPPSKVFDAEATQEAVYESGARDVVLGAIDGFNGTIFAYVDEERGRRDRARVDGRRRTETSGEERRK